MQKLKQSLLHHYFSVRNSWPVWYNVLNRDAKKRFSANKPSLSLVQQKIVDNLREDGIAFTTLDEVFPGEDMTKTLQNYMEKIGKVDGAQVRKKNFLHPYWDEKSTFDFSNPFFELSLRSEVLNIVNSYDNMWRRLNYIHLTETIPVGDSSATASQRWHRDPQEKRQVKTFIYLNDVDNEAGPFTFVKKSQFKSPVYGNTFPQALPLGIYPPEGAVEKTVNAEDIIAATGKAGTMIFCDTAGLHRGGYAKSKSRFMFTGFYPSAKWDEPRLYTPSVDTSSLSAEARFALYLE